MLAETNEKPGVEEAYSTATNTSDLTVDAECRGAGDVLIAAGWSPTRLGGALLRLHSEWDGAAKPERPTAARVAALVGTFQRTLPGHGVEGAPVRLTPDRARAYAAAWYQHEMALVMTGLAALPSVREQVATQATIWGVEQPRAVAAEVIRYWLDQTCRTCHGLKWQTAAGAPALTGRVCKTCRGSGAAEVPHGQPGRRLANYMDDCVSRARSSIAGRLRSMRS